MESRGKVLIIDKSSDRKTRINAIKERGFAVFPALKLEEARNRCRPGAYDLIVVSGSDDQETALAFCEQLRERRPPQAVLLAIPDDGPIPARDYVVPTEARRLADRVESILGRQRGDQSNEEVPIRATA